MVALKDYNILINKTVINVVEFISILLIGLVIGRFLGKLTYKLLHELEINRLLTKRLNVAVKVEKIASKIVQYIVYIVSLVYALKTVGINIKFLYYMLIIVLIVLVLYIILQIKDYIENLFIGTFFINKEFLKPGQRIKIKGIEGIIVKVTLTEIKIITEKNDVFFIPNVVLRKSSLFRKN